MKRFIALISLAVVAACEPLPDDYAGSVSDFNGRLVKIEGVMGSDGQPSKAMQETAKMLCKGPVRFVGATVKPGSASTVTYGPLGSYYTSGDDLVPMYHYAFACV